MKLSTNSSIIAPDHKRSSVKEVASMLDSANASRHKIEFPANASRAIAV
ncbi:hypothetical protein GLIP_2448 [Aliiglaciecola lipolytica E3]|uniref:Uncharacterized protein n=1 Tax=Aliiglaciecola lipolytica E3 TaxID=1127673 RepID=K6X357_9ALTE|nr:hypothetical protein GLIP_2448 [Aliiglaciecola lipolytica E3]